MSEIHTILASMTACELAMFRSMGGVVPFGVHPVEPAWHKAARVELPPEVVRSPRPGHFHPGTPVHVEGLGTFPSVSKAALAMGVSGEKFGRELAAGRRWIGGWRVRKVKVRWAA